MMLFDVSNIGYMIVVKLMIFKYIILKVRWFGVIVV